jgi:hypothetical protein
MGWVVANEWLAPMSQPEVAPGRYSLAHHSLAKVVAACPANNRTRKKPDLANEWLADEWDHQAR